MMKNIVILSAARFEADPTLLALEQASAPHEYFEFGIGPLNAAAQSHKLNELTAGKNVIFLGSCGVFGTFDAPKLVSTIAVYWSPIGERLGKSYGVKNIHPPLFIPNEKRRVFTELENVETLCAPSISKVPDQKQDTVTKYKKVENLELYPVLNACKNCESFNVILGITNEIGPEAHQQWKSNHQEVARMTSEKVLSELL